MKRPIVFGVLAISLLCWNANAADPKSVLLIYDARSETRGNLIVDQTFRKVLGDKFGFDLDIRSEYFEIPPSPAEDFPLLARWLHRKYSGRPFDVVVPVGVNALQFVHEYGQEMFVGSHVVFWGRKSALDAWGSGPGQMGMVAPGMDSQINGTFAFIRALQPDLQRLIVVSGTSPIDRAWEATARQVLSPFEGAIEVSYVAGRSLEDVEAYLVGLGQRTAVLLLSINEDGTGRRLVRTQFLSALVQKASAPVYSTSALDLDADAVGGALLDQELMTIEAAEMVASLLRGEDISSMPVREAPLIPMVNWQALKRWNLDENRLPPDTGIRYREPSIWDMYRWRILAVLALCILETCLIIALLVHRANRRRAEKAMSESKQQLQSTIDALTARVALLDQDGTIVAVNRRWLEAGNSGIRHEEGQLLSDGIRRLKSGEQEDFRCVYSTDESGVVSWFQVRINRFDMDGVPRFVVTYEDVTEIKKAHDDQQHLTGLLMRAQDEERRRIARDLHDVTVQNLVAIKADLASMNTEALKMQPHIEEMFHESLSLCDQVIKELRTLSYLLHPPYLDEAGLVPALRWFVRGFVQRSGIQVDLQIADDIGRLPTETETTLFRTVQESLSNIHRHSGSKSAVISVARLQDAIVLQIIDKGHGFSRPTAEDRQDSALSAGVGIQSMRQRLRQIGGQLEIESSPEGTRVYARISISEDRTADIGGR